MGLVSARMWKSKRQSKLEAPEDERGSDPSCTILKYALAAEEIPLALVRDKVVAYFYKAFRRQVREVPAGCFLHSASGGLVLSR